MPAEDWFRAIFDGKLSKPRSFAERAAWTIFWTFVHGCDSIAQSAHADDQEPELNGALIKAIEEGCRRFSTPLTSQSLASCIAVGFLNLAKSGNEARTGADFGIAIEVKVDSRSCFVVSHIQAKRARHVKLDVNRAAGDSSQLERLLRRHSGRYLFYNQHGHPNGLFPSTMSAELVNEISSKGTREIHALELADDFAVSVAAAVGYAARLARCPPLSQPRKFGYDFADSLDGAVRILYPNDAEDLKISKLLVARVGERHFSPSDVADLEKAWQDAVGRRLAGFETERWITLNQEGQDEHLPPLTEF